MTVAFTLFGLMLGLNDTIELVEKRAHSDSIFSFPRFSYIGGMPIAVARQIARMPHVSGTTVSSFVPGYLVDPKNRVFVNVVDDQMWRLFPDWGITNQQWNAVQHNRTGSEWHRKPRTSKLIASQLA
jgi:hypothetical protein